jgi:hypothetical protein
MQDDEGQLLTPAEVASLMPGMTVAALAQLRYRGGGPAYLKPTPRRVYYRDHDVRAWLERSRIGSER